MAALRRESRGSSSGCTAGRSWGGELSPMPTSRLPAASQAKPPPQWAGLSPPSSGMASKTASDPSTSRPSRTENRDTRNSCGRSASRGSGTYSRKKCPLVAKSRANTNPNAPASPLVKDGTRPTTLTPPVVASHFFTVPVRSKKNIEPPDPKSSATGSSAAATTTSRSSRAKSKLPSAAGNTPPKTQAAASPPWINNRRIPQLNAEASGCHHR